MPILNMIYWATWWGGWWQPWANTVAYYPLDSTNTVNDLSWNNHTLTWWATFWTYAGVDCCSFTSTSSMLKLNSSLISWTSPFTINMWIYNSTAVNDVQIVSYMGSFSAWASTSLWINPSTKHLMVGYLSGVDANFDTSYTVSTGTWFNVWTVYDGTDLSIYVDGTFVSSVTTAYSLVSWTTCLGYATYSNMQEYLRGYMSNVIYEDVAWTAQEIADYYDLTKWNYGL